MSLAILCKCHNGPLPIGSMQVRAFVLVEYTHDPEMTFLGTTVVYLRTFFPYWNRHLSEQVWLFQHLIQYYGFNVISISACEMAIGGLMLQIAATANVHLKRRPGSIATVHIFA